jgi:alginate production protein
VATELTRRDVGGWGLDAGINWMLPLPWEPRLYAGYAFGSGDSSPESGDDHSFRQTGIETNEAGYGGVERFAQYGIALDPELSNLGILTIGAGLGLLRSSSLDLVYHYYRLVEPAEALRDSRLDFELDGQHRDLGHGVDLMLGLEEWERFELFLGLSAFRAGRAFGMEQGTWSYGGFCEAIYAF